MNNIIGEPIDYQAIANKLQHELELARLEIVRMRFSARPFLFDSKDIKRFVADNYLVIMAIAILCSVGISFFDTLKSLFDKETKA